MDIVGIQYLKVYGEYDIVNVSCEFIDTNQLLLKHQNTYKSDTIFTRF